MTYLQKKKLAFMSIVNQIKGFVRTISGAPPLKLYDCVDADSIINYTIDGNSVQNGTPTPENPVEVESVGEKTRNIWYPSVDALTSNGITCTRNNDNTYTVNGTATADFYFSIGKITIEVGTTYYLSGGTSQAPIAFQLREGSTGVTTLYNHGGITTFSPTGKHSIDIINCVIVVRSGVAVNNIVVKPMISLENTDEYEPYGKYKIPVKCSGINLFNPEDVIAKFNSGDTYMSSAYTCTKIQLKPNTRYYMKTFRPKYGGYFFLSNNQAVSTYLDGTIGVNYDAGNAYPRGYEESVTTDKTGCLYIGHYVVSGSNNRDKILRENKIQIVEGSYTALTAPDYEPYVEPTITNIYLDEPLAEGQTISYKDDNLPKLPTIKGTTIYSIDTKRQPSNMSATYYSTAKE